METVNTCPLCGHSQTELFLESQDFFLTGEAFNIHKCLNCGLKFTNPRPDPDQLPGYYESLEYVSHDTQDKSLFNFIYRGARWISLQRKTSLVKKNSNGNKILDIGCGTGEFLKACREEGYDVTGIEPNEKAAGFARAVNKIPVFPEEELEKMESGQYDVITLWHVLEHVHDLNERMRTVKRLLKETGTLIIALPNALSWDAFFYGKYWAAYDLPRHLYHFSMGSFNFLARKHGFSINQILGMKMDAFYISLLSEKYMNKRSDPVAALLNGIRSNYHGGKNSGYSSMIYLMKIDFGQNKPL